MLGRGLVFLALCATAPAFGADLPAGLPPPGVGGGAPPPPPPFGGPPPAELRGFRPGAVWGPGGVAWGLVPGVGQLGAAGFGYYAVRGCWTYQPVYDQYGNFFGEQPVDVCVN